MTSVEKAKFEDAVRRADPAGTEHERTGMNSMFTGSKAYACVPKLYAEDKRKGARGIYVGPKATPQWIEGPEYGTTREIIKHFVFPKVEGPPDPKKQEFLDHGNEYEPVALDFYTKLHPRSTIVVPGRIRATDPLYRDWMSATPDALCYDEGEDKAFILEIKCLYRRNFKFLGPEPEKVWVPGRFSHRIARKEGDEDILEDREFGGIYRQDGALIPGKYIFQLLLECYSANIHRVRFVQLLTGGCYARPVISITEWEFDAELFRVMSIYWKAAWNMGETARLQLSKLVAEREKARMQGNMEEVANFENRIRFYEDNCPWPEPKPRATDWDARKYMPNIFPYFSSIKE